MNGKVALGRSEPLCAGICMLIALGMVAVATVIRSFDFEELGTIDTESELSDMHDDFTKDRDTILFAAGLFWFSFPFFVLHLFFITRVFNTILSFYDSNTNFPFSFGLEKIYTVTIVIVIMIVSCIEPCLMVLTVYYDWEFTDSSGDTSYTGYYIQLLLAYSTTVLHDSIAIPLIILANIPWVWFICVDLIARPSNQEDKDKKRQMSNRIMCCHGLFGNFICSLILILFIVALVLVTLMTLFSWDSYGFWSYYGYSQSLEHILVISFVLVGVWLIYISCRLDTINTFLANNDNDDYTAIDQEPQDNI